MHRFDTPGHRTARILWDREYREVFRRDLQPGDAVVYRCECGRLMNAAEVRDPSNLGQAQ